MQPLILDGSDVTVVKYLMVTAEQFLGELCNFLVEMLKVAKYNVVMRRLLFCSFSPGKYALSILTLAHEAMAHVLRSARGSPEVQNACVAFVAKSAENQWRLRSTRVSYCLLFAVNVFQFLNNSQDVQSYI